jgi:hypothetical protein
MKFAGTWHITEMEMWAADYFNLEVQAYLRIGADGVGDFQFGLVAGGLDGEVVRLGNTERFEFTWEGTAELDPVSGGGWLSLKGEDRATGRIKIHQGDGSAFSAVRAYGG